MKAGATVLSLALGGLAADAFITPSLLFSRASVHASTREGASGVTMSEGGSGLAKKVFDLSDTAVITNKALVDYQERRKTLLAMNPEKEPVEQAMTRFNNLYTRPVIPFYRTTLYELVQTAHLAKMDETFMYTHFFAYGFIYAFETIFKGYPLADEWKLFCDAAAKSANLDPEKLRKDADTLKAWFGKTESDFERAISSPKEDDALEQELAAIKARKGNFLPERYFSFGLCKTMEAGGSEVNWDNIKKWCNLLGLDETRTQLDWDLLDRSMRRLADVELLMKQVEIREKKRLAERLEGKAKKAAEAAAEQLASSTEKEKENKQPVVA